MSFNFAVAGSLPRRSNAPTGAVGTASMRREPPTARNLMLDEPLFAKRDADETETPPKLSRPRRIPGPAGERGPISLQSRVE